MLRRQYRRVRADLARPAGGWTAGALYALLILMSPVLLFVGGLWAALGRGLLLGAVGALVLWGAHGYLPRQ